MVSFIIGIILLIIAVVLLIGAKNLAKSEAEERANGSRNAAEGLQIGKWVTRGLGIVLSAVSALLLVLSIVFAQGVGEAKVIVNADGKVATTKLDPGLGVKAPWQNTVDFDIFQQQVLFAGTTGNAPSYSGGEVNGGEVTATVKRGAQAFIDASIVYSLDPAKAEDTYNEYRSQERFTRQIVIPAILSSIRDIPSAYTPVEFRGEFRGEATGKMIEAMNAKLNKYGVEVSNVDLQDIRYTEQVEESIKAVEVAQQREETAQADLRATEVSAQAQIVEAEAKAKAEIAAAQGTAEANRLLTESLTPQVLQNKYIEAIKNGTTFVVPEGSTPLVTTNGGSAK